MKNYFTPSLETHFNNVILDHSLTIYTLVTVLRCQIWSYRDLKTLLHSKSKTVSEHEDYPYFITVDFYLPFPPPIRWTCGRAPTFTTFRCLFWDFNRSSRVRKLTPSTDSFPDYWFRDREDGNEEITTKETSQSFRVNSSSYVHTILNLESLYRPLIKTPRSKSVEG